MDRPLAVDYMSLGNVLVRQRKLTEAQLGRALEEQRRLGGGEGRNPLLGTILVKLKMCSEGDLRCALAAQAKSEPPTLERTAAAQDGLDAALASVSAATAELGRVTRSKTQELDSGTAPLHARVAHS